MGFEVGKEVVCIKSGRIVKKGDTETVASFCKSHIGCPGDEKSVGLIFIGTKAEGGCCFKSSYFIPLDEITKIEVIEESVTKTETV